MEQLPDQECPFCKEDIEGSAFVASGNFLAIYNLAPILDGHSLIIPRRHVSSMMDLNQEEREELLNFAIQSTNVLLEAFHGEGFDWSVQDGIVAGQTVPHLHMHIVIRKAGDLEASSDWHDKVVTNSRVFLDSEFRRKLSIEEYRNVAEFLRCVALSKQLKGSEKKK